LASASFAIAIILGVGGKDLRKMLSHADASALVRGEAETAVRTGALGEGGSEAAVEDARIRIAVKQRSDQES
jgi:hypothetical protein